MYSSSTLEQPRKMPVKTWLLLGSALVIAVLYILSFVVQGELGQFMLAGAQSLPFAVLAVFAYLGIDRTWAKILTLVWLGGLIALTGLLGLLMGFAGLLDGSLTTPGTVPSLKDGAGLKLALLAILSLIGTIIGVLAFIPAVRRALSRILPIDPASFVHMTALVATVTLTLLCFIPLLVLFEPPLLTVVNAMPSDAVSGNQDAAAQLRTTVYGLLWTIPCTIVAVGYAVRRNLGQALTRLGLVRPTIRQVIIGVVAAIGLVIAVQVLGLAINWIWTAMGWPQTDGEAFGELMQFAFSPLGAVVIGITAGLGEELAVRGVLQPRLGILLSNLFFTSLHAYQYNWDSLIVVFVVGLLLGLLRKRTNTTTSAITHGLYDFILIIGSVYNLPGLGQ